MVDKSTWLKKINLDNLLWFHKDTSKSVIILCSPRTGSTLLSSYLNSLKAFRSYGEVLNPQIYPFFGKITNFPYKRFLALLKIRFILSQGNSSVKLIFSQLEKLGIDLGDLQTSFPSARFLIIYRKSLLDCYISSLRAQETREWSSKSNNVEPPNATFQIDKDAFLNFCHQVKSAYLKCNSESLLTRSLVIEYEELAADPQNLFAREICPFLDVSYVPVKSRLRKQIQTPLSQLIENFDEMSDLLSSKDTLLHFDRDNREFY